MTTLAAHRSLASRLTAPWPAVLFGLVGMVLVVAPVTTGGRIPGDLGDARLNSYLLEHFHRWITGADPHFWTAPFFYPYPLTIAFSDNYLGDGFLYSLIRFAGFSREDAFDLWFALGFVLDFIAADFVLVRLGYSRVAAAMGAFLFTFSMPMSAQEVHAQLIYRFCLPFAVLCMVRFCRRGAFIDLLFCLGWLTWQFYCSIYVGYFTALILTALSLAMVADRLAGRTPPLKPPDVAARALGLWRAEPRKRLFLIGVAALLGLLAVLFAPYFAVSRLYGFGRSWDMISLMAPRPQSYVLAINSKIWPSTGPLFDTLPMKIEHGMFIGAAPWLAIGLAAFLRRTKRSAPDPLFWPVVLSIALLAALTLWVRGYSLYYLLSMVPGANAIRALSRIIVALLFPFAILVASSVDGMLTPRLPARMGPVIAGLIAVLLIVESSFVTHIAETKAAWRARLAVVGAQLPAKLPTAPILLVGPKADDEPFARELDGMIYAQDRGWPTINGYSGNWPPTHEVGGACTDPAADLAAGLKFARVAQADLPALERRVILAGYPDCSSPFTPSGSPSPKGGGEGRR